MLVHTSCLYSRVDKTKKIGGFVSFLNNVSISTKLITGFGVLGFFLIVSGITGYRSTEGLGEKLSYVTGPAWDTTDGAMEGTIGLQQAMSYFS